MKKTLVSSFIVCCLLGFVQNLVADTQSDISLQVQKEIDSQLKAANEPMGLYAGNEGIQKKISCSVKKTLDKQIYSKLHCHARSSVYGGEAAFSNPSLFVYKVPKNPRQARFFLKKDLFALDINLQFATQAYNDSGGTYDISDLVFQKCPIRIKDILLASKLIDTGVGTPTTDKYKFLEILKDQILSFDASTNAQEFIFSYVRHFLRGDISLGLQIPIVRRSHRIKLTSCLTTQVNTQLQEESTDFFTLYPNGLIDFFKDILSRKDISFNENDAEVGIGDVTVFANYEIPSKHYERCLVGARALFPTARKRDIHKLWDPELGNGGFTELSAFGSILFDYSRWFNPHAFTQLTYAFKANVCRRVPKYVSDSDIENVSNALIKFGDDFMIYGNGVKYVATQPEFCELDACVKRFADTGRKVKVHHGGNLFFRIGNIMERVFSSHAFFDLFYDLYGKWKDYIGFRRVDEDYNASLLTKNSYEIAHRIGANFSWQPDDSWRLHIGGMYAFAGRNTPRSYEINGAISLQF